MSQNTTNREEGPLKGLKVLDFGRYIAGPACASLLRDYGATVTRVERISGGEDRWMSPVTDGGDGANFCHLARGKRSLALNPKDPRGKEIIRKQIATADVIVANLPEAGLAAMGISWDEVHRINPRCVLVSNTAFGTDGPMGQNLGFDGLGQALSGAMHLTGPEEMPTKAHAPYVDYCSAVLAAFGTMVALKTVAQTGQGQRVETALFHTALFTMGNNLIEEDLLGLGRVGTTNRAQVAGPADSFQCADGWIFVNVIGPGQFRRWCDLVGKPEWKTDSRFDNDLKRGEAGELLSETMQDWCSAQTMAAVLVKLQESGIPGARILTPTQALSEPQALAMNFLDKVNFPNHSTQGTAVTTPVRLSHDRVQGLAAAPKLGEHTHEVLSELGYSDADIDALRRDAVVL